MSAHERVLEDPVDVAVPHYDEDAEEAFTGPDYPGYIEDELEGDIGDLVGEVGGSSQLWQHPVHLAIHLLN